MSADNMITRSSERERFTRIDNLTLQDQTLSWAARGLLSYLLSLPPDWTIYVADLIKRSPGGRRVVMTSLHQLEAAGYVKMRETRVDRIGRALPVSAEKGKFAPAIQCVHERPVTTCEHDQPVRETCNGPVRETYTGTDTGDDLPIRDEVPGSDQCAKRHMAERAPTNYTQQETTEETTYGTYAPTPTESAQDGPTEKLGGADKQWLDIREALMVVCDIQPRDLTRSGKGKLHAATSDLRLVNATVKEIRMFAEWWIDEYPEAKLTSTAISSNWHDCWNYRPSSVGAAS